MEQFVSNFEEACARKGISTVLPDVSSFPEYLQKHTIANYKLSVIIGVNNDEWTPDIKDTDQYKYYPWFRIEEDDMGPAGFRLSYGGYVYDYSFSTLGVRLACKSRELAKFMGENCADLYAELHA
jgi:hypothetical protein